MNLVIETVLIALLGWAGGALVNYLADVLPAHLRPVLPFCRKCQARQPLANYLIWPRRCPSCQRRRSWRVWVVEAASIAAALWLWQTPPERLGFALGFLLLVYLGLVALIDLEHRLILFSLSLAGILLGTIAGVWIQLQRGVNVGQALLYTFLGGACGFVLMFLLYHLGALLARWMARQRGEALEEEALGFGDVHLGLILGLILGWPVIFFGLTAGIIIGGVASLFYLLVKVIAGRHRFFTAIPYGPYLIAGAVLLLYFR